jgi:hypothetical protein
VRSFTLTSGTAHPRAGVPFNVTLNIRVAENVAALPDVYLPVFFGPQELGDERQIRHDRAGTLYRETLRLVTYADGPLHIGSAYLDAIDARDGKPKRFISNSLDLRAGASPAIGSARRVFGIAAAVLAALLAAVFGRRLLQKRRTIPPALPSMEPEPVVNGVAGAVARLAEQRDRRAVLHLRSELWASLGARDGETLQDVLARMKAVDGVSRRMLMLVEEAAFIEDSRLEAAVTRVLEVTG